VWIAAWRGANDQLTAVLSNLIESGEARLNPLIKAELLQGAKDSKHQDAITALLHPMAVMPIEDEIWRDAPKIYLKCRKSSLNLTTIDCLLASHAISERMPIWSLDHIFEKIAQHSSLKLFQ
jgi:predicted nucleic acid-binding protein